MVFLKKIYSSPDDLFDEIEFHNGINIIYGEKRKTNLQQDSLNGIGKSSALDLINFCLLSNLPPRLKMAASFLKPYTIGLIIEIDGIDYTIQRSTGEPNTVYFGTDNKMKKYKKDELKEILCDLFFKDPSYEGIYKDEWFRKLIPFFLKIQQKGKQTYRDALTYLDGARLLEVFQYHMFLLGFDNSISYENYSLKTELKVKQEASKQIKRFIEEKYLLKDIQDSNNKISIINREIEELSNSIKIFKLKPKYDDLEQSANRITELIQSITYNIHINKRKLREYYKSIDIPIDIDPHEIASIYEEINKKLAVEIKKTLDEAIEFKKQLISSRTNFISSEIDRIETVLDFENERLKELDKERSEIFQMLDEREAIKDLTEAYSLLHEKKNKVNELSAKLQTYNDFQTEINVMRSKEAALNNRIISFLGKIENGIDNFRSIFNSIYNVMYIEDKDKGIFSIIYNFKKDSKLEIKIDAPDIYSEGKNRGCILLYDLSILFNAIEQNRRLPRFLVHDGIFDGIHKSHFVSLMNYLEEKSKNQRFQYIFTANKEDIFMKEAVDCGELEFDIEEKAVEILRPDKKLFKRTYP